jgi:hypothetical protein
MEKYFKPLFSIKEAMFKKLGLGLKRSRIKFKQHYFPQKGDVPPKL